MARKYHQYLLNEWINEQMQESYLSQVDYLDFKKTYQISNYFPQKTFFGGAIVLLLSCISA